jgi:arabinofuranan 3-O-arabinosyltransferase
MQEIRSLPTPFSIHLLRLSSPAPLPVPPPAGGGRVLDAGSVSQSSIDGVRVALDGPAWLVLGQSFSEGWRATCDGRSLGEPRPVNGYANGWLAPADCRDVAFTYGPQGAAQVGYAISAAVCLLLLGFVAVGGLLRRRRPAGLEAPPPLLRERRARPMPLARAAAVALAATLPLAFLFAARSSIAIFPVLTLILWRGVGPGPLTAGAAALLGVAVPLIYLVWSPTDRGGYNFEYSSDLLGAHWVAVAALILLMVACWRALPTAETAGGPPEPRPATRPRGATPSRRAARSALPR